MGTPNPPLTTTRPTIGHDLSDLLNLAPHKLAEMLPSLAERYPERIEEFRSLAYQRFSGFALEKLLLKLDRVAALPGVQSLFQQQVIEAAQKLSPPAELPAEPHSIRVDPELARLAVGLKRAPEFRLWLVLLQIARDSNKNGVLRADLEAALRDYNVPFCERSLRRWLRRGHGLFWNLTSYGKVWLIGYARVSLALVNEARARKLPDLIETNRPGARYMYVPVGGRIGQFEAACYAAWLASREDPTIARSTLARLFNRQPRILRQWEAATGVQVNNTTVQYPAEFTDAVPEHAYTYTETPAQWRAQHVNQYHAPDYRQHHRRGQSRKVSRLIRQILDSDQPAGVCEQASGQPEAGGLKPTGKQYFGDFKRAKSSARYSARQDQKERARYVRFDRSKPLMEYSPDGQQRTRPVRYCGGMLVLAKGVLYA